MQHYTPRVKTLTLRKKIAQTMRNLLMDFRYYEAGHFQSARATITLLQRTGQLANLEGMPCEAAVEELRKGWSHPSWPA